jgi:hypothetical protein
MLWFLLGVFLGGIIGHLAHAFFWPWYDRRKGD